MKRSALISEAIGPSVGAVRGARTIRREVATRLREAGDSAGKAECGAEL